MSDFKKLTAVIILLVLSIAFTGCGDKGKEPEEFLSPMAETGTLEISILYDNRFLDIAVKEFNKKFPGWEVSVINYDAMTLVQTGENSVMSSTDPEIIEKYVTEISAQLMSGQGPDIIDMNCLPAHNLMRANVLTDLNPYFDSDDGIDKNSLMPGLLKAMEYNGKLFEIPLSFYIEGMSTAFNDIPVDVGDRVPRQWTWEEMTAYFEPVLEEYKLSYLIDTPPQYLTSMAVNNYFSYLVDFENGVCDFEGPIFTETLKSIKTLYDRGLLPDVKESLPEIRGIGDGVSLLSYYVLGGEMSSYKTLTSMLRTMSGNMTQHFSFPNTQGVSGNAFRENGSTYAINANSGQKNAAWEFIKLILSDEMQLSPELYGIPINQNIAKEDYKREAKMFEGKDVSDEEADAYLKERSEFLSTVERFRPDNDVLPGIIRENTLDYFTGDATLEETAAKVQSEVQRWLNEIK